MKSKTTAAIIALIAGSFGVHRFYLGQTGKGLLYLAFCWTFIPAIVAFCDAIIFLTMDEARFDAKYNFGYVAPQRAAGQPTVVIHNNLGGYPQPEPQFAAAPTPANSAAATVKMPRKDPFELKGDEQYENYEFEEAIVSFRRSLNVNSRNADAHYKLARLYSIMERKSEALFHLRSAIANGFYDFDEIASHDHLAYLRSQPEYEQFRAAGFLDDSTNEILPGKEDKLELRGDVLDQLEKLALLKENGIITDEDFQQRKQTLLR